VLFSAYFLAGSKGCGRVHDIPPTAASCYPGFYRTWRQQGTLLLRVPALGSFPRIEAVAEEPRKAFRANCRLGQARPAGGAQPRSSTHSYSTRPTRRAAKALASASCSDTGRANVSVTCKLQAPCQQPDVIVIVSIMQSATRPGCNECLAPEHACALHSVHSGVPTPRHCCHRQPSYRPNKSS
jgi:hypothetical protein